jgi:uncharacterized protein
MPLIFNLRHLERGPLHLQGELSPEELELTGVDELIEVPEPVHYDLNIERLGQNVLVQGKLQTTLRCQCVRCLQPVTYQVDLQGWACDLPLEGEEPVKVTNDCVDLTPYLREDILLAFPQHPLCGPDCRGLLDPEHNLQEPASVDRPGSGASKTWAELDKLKF